MSLCSKYQLSISVTSSTSLRIPSNAREALQQAWSLADKVLIVSGRLTSETKALGDITEFADGCLTSHGTFQKFYEQHELKTWIEHSLKTTVLPAGPGVFYVFRDDGARAAFQSSRYRRQLAAPRRNRSVELFSAHETLLNPLIAFVTERGRLPADAELENYAELYEVFGSTKRAFRIVQLATSKEQWDEIAQERAQELLIYLALSRFDGRPKYFQLPRDLQLDVEKFLLPLQQGLRESRRTPLFSWRSRDDRHSLRNFKAWEISAIGTLHP